jgi:hypothetical protein
LTDALDPVAAIRIRRAQPADAAVLTSLAPTSKAVSGYDAGFMAGCRTELAIAAQSIARHPTRVIQQHGQALGLISCGSVAPWPKWRSSSSRPQ